MKIADHAYVPNGLGAINDEGWKPCARCGHAPGAHATKAVPMDDPRPMTGHHPEYKKPRYGGRA